MDCPQCGYDMEPLDKVCARCHGQGISSVAKEPEAVPAVRATPPRVPEIQVSTIGTALAALIAVGFLLYLLSGIVTHHELEFVSQNGSGYDVTTFKAFGFFWWFLVGVCMFAIFVCINKIVNTRR